ncbi:hypothetical protein IR388_004658 [Escherichia coli]|nr:hypothetical protein [Escherichia coli]
MDEKSLYAHILNLSAPWQVKSLSLDENAGSVTVTVGIAENAWLACPTCGKSSSVHDHRQPQKVIQALVGHRDPRSMEVYTRVFALDMVATLAVPFTVLQRSCVHCLP